MPLRFLFDEHLNLPACQALRKRGLDVTHVIEMGLAGASDPEVLSAAAAESRIMVTRNYSDFAKLVEAFNARGRSFPGVLFVPVSLPQTDAGALVRAIERWIAAWMTAGPEGIESERSPIADGVGWLSV